jgi:unsaturated rhamnogalacturonyl hydrolase
MHRCRKVFPLILSLGIASVLAAGCATNRTARQDDFNNWPTGASPAEIGKRVAENFVAGKFGFETIAQRRFVIYPEVCAWYGSLTVAGLTGDRDLQTRLINKLNLLLTPEGSQRISQRAHVDYRVFGVVPLEIFIQTKDKKFLELGKIFADKQWAANTTDGITAEARYWIDDMFMITALQVQAYRATRDAKYLDRAAWAMSAYLDRLQQSNGLFYHGTNAPFFWGRGNGWVAAGMTELLRSLPENHPRRAYIMASYKKMMAALLQYQGEDGLWRQLLDHPEAWPETSCTGMFAFALVTGVKNGWLDKKSYGPAARKAWLGLIGYLDNDANVREVCVGTGKGTNVEYYLNRPREIGDLHGQAPILWTASALLR